MKTTPRLPRIALLTEVAEQLQSNGSWTGETHVQKSVYLLQDLFGVPCGFDFVLYRHGPFSFDLRDELTAMRADGLLDVLPQPPPYGPRLRPTDLSRALRDRLPRTIAMFRETIGCVAQAIGDRNASDLEKVATAWYIWSREQPQTVNALARRLHQLKPHISVGQATEAVSELTGIGTECGRAMPALPQLSV